MNVPIAIWELCGRGFFYSLVYLFPTGAVIWLSGWAANAGFHCHMGSDGLQWNWKPWEGCQNPSRYLPQGGDKTGAFSSLEHTSLSKADLNAAGNTVVALLALQGTVVALVTSLKVT